MKEMKNVKFVSVLVCLLIMFACVQLRIGYEAKKESERKAGHIPSQQEVSEAEKNKYADTKVFTDPNFTRDSLTLGMKNAEKTPPVETPKQDSIGTYPTLAGLEMIGKGKHAPVYMPLYTGTDMDRYWYVFDGETDMGMMNVQDIKGLVILCKGPVIYDFIISEPGKKACNLRIKSLGNNQGQTWDWINKEWGPTHAFEYEKIFNISGVRVLKDSEDPTPIQVEIGFP